MSSSHASPSGEPEPETEGEEAEEQSEEEEDKNNRKEASEAEFSLPQLFVTLQSNKKALKKLSRSLPSSISQLEQRFESSSDFDMFEKRGYFYESVGGVFYTLEWPVKSSSSEPEMPQNCEHLVCDNTKEKATNCGKFFEYFHKYVR